jgi:hypothetical protein
MTFSTGEGSSRQTRHFAFGKYGFRIGGPFGSSSDLPCPDAGEAHRRTVMRVTAKAPAAFRGNDIFIVMGRFPVKGSISMMEWMDG